MSFTRQEHEHVFPQDHDRIFDALIVAIKKCQFRLISEERTIGSVTASSGASGFSWGERLSFNVYPKDGCTVLTMTSALKVGVNIGGAHHHQKNFDAIIKAIGNELAPPPVVNEPVGQKANRPMNVSGTPAMPAWSIIVVVAFALAVCALLNLIAG